MMDLVSVVVITYNEEKTIGDTLDSIYKQTYPRLELVIADDCSRDKTAQRAFDWIQKHAARFERAVVVSSPYNTGVSANVNRGIRAIKGKYFATVAGDDLWYSEKIELEYNYLIQNNYEMVFSKIDISGENKVAVKQLRNFCEEGYRSILAGYDEQRKMILRHNIVAGPSWGVRTRESYDRMGGFEEGYPFLDDYPYLYRYIMNGNEIHLLDKVLAKYNLRDRSLSKGNNRLFADSDTGFLMREKIYGLLKEGMYDEIVRQIPWDRKMKYTEAWQGLLTAWLSIKRKGFSLDQYFDERGVKAIGVVGIRRARDAVIRESYLTETIDSQKETEDFLEAGNNVVVGNADAYLICDLQIEEYKTLAVLWGKPVYWIGEIIEKEYKRMRDG